MNLTTEQFDEYTRKTRIQALRDIADELEPRIPGEMFDGSALHDLDTANWLRERADAWEATP